MIIQDLFESPQLCPECGGISFSDLILAEKKDACYYKVKASAKVWPSAYASGRLVQCRKKGAANYGKSKNEGMAEGLNEFALPGSNNGGDDGFSEETLKRLAAQWYNNNEDPRVERTLMAAGWEIGQDEGYDDEPGVFVVQSGDVNGSSYISWPAHELKQSVAEGSGFDQEAGIGIDGKSFKFKIRDLVALADNYPVSKINPQQFSKQIADRDEDSTQSMARAEKADLQYPIIVVKRQNGQLWIADGTHRAHKAILNKLPSISAKIIPIKDMAPFDVEQGMAEGKVSGYKMYPNHDGTWYVEDENENVVLRNASEGEAQQAVWSGNQKLKQGVAEGSLDEIDRRGFLKGLGAAAVAGAAGGALAQSKPADISAELARMTKDDPRIQHNKDVNELARAIYERMVAERGQPMDRRQQQQWLEIARLKAEARFSQYAPGKPSTTKPSAGFPSQPSEYRRSRNLDNFESVDQGVAEDAALAEEFDLIESTVTRLAKHNDVDAELIWEDLESLSDDELYVFAVTMPLTEDWQKANKQDRTDGMSRRAVKAYRREHPGSKLKTAVTTKPSKLKRGSKASKRRKSYCSRSRGQMKMHSISCAKTPDKAICKARRRWNCE